jgi:two-component sensor histidine kinase
MASSAVLPKEDHNLALAMVAVSDAPLLLLDAHYNVTAASASFCKAYDIDPARVRGRQFFELGDGEWAMGRLRSVMNAAASSKRTRRAYETDFKRPGRPKRRLTVKVNRLNHAAGVETHLLLTIVDVTDARSNERIKESLIRENAMLIQENQHRIANSLQIIASVLLQSARSVGSHESRSHLRDAHQRVMSVAAVQRQLAASNLGNVELRPYFTQLGASLGASMIADPSKIKINVVTDDTIVSAEVSVSLGLIITELVINALSHAFSDGRHGAVTISYQARGPNWTLAVADDGIGMPANAKPKAGLGTGIIAALSKQLHAKVETADNAPGTSVSIVRNQIAIVRKVAIPIA